MKERHKNQKGQALIETALILPLLLILILGIMEFGRGFYLKNTLENAARAGARFAVVQSPWGTSSPQAVIDYTTANIYSGIKNDFPPAGSKGNVTVTVTPQGTTTALPSPPAIPVSGDIVTVTVTWNNFKPLLFSYSGWVMNITPTLSGQASMRYE